MIQTMEESSSSRQTLQDEGREVSAKENQPTANPQKRARVQSPVVSTGSASEASTENPPKRQRGGIS